MGLISSGGGASTAKQWIARDADLLVYFDDSDSARFIYVTDPLPDRRSFQKRICSQLGF